LFHDIPTPPPTVSFFNFSSIKLSTHDKAVLSSSYRHVFRPYDTTPLELEKSLLQFQRRLAINYEFRDNDDNTGNGFISSIYVPNLSYKPPKRHLVVQACNGLTLPIMFDIKNPPPRSRLSPFDSDLHYRAFKKIIDNQDIILTLADKNIGLVLLDRSHYSHLVTSLIDNPNFLRLGDLTAASDTLMLALQGYKNFLNFFYRSFSKFEQTHLMRDLGLHRYQIPEFYALPKLHKKLPETNDTHPILPMRPIVGAFRWITTSLSKLVGVYLEPIFSNHPLYPKDSKSAIPILEGFYCDDSPFFLFSLDVVALYPSMDIEDTVDAMKELLLFYPKLPNWLPAAVELILQTTFFHYNGIVYHQQQGMAMGTNMAVLVAIAYLHIRLENHPLVQYMMSKSIALYMRYVDDIVGAWTGSVSDFNNFCDQLQTLIPGIRFTVVLDQPLPFLDLLLHPHQHTISISCFQKSINTYSYITPLSNHPTALKRGFIKGELIRYCRNSSYFKDFCVTRAHFWRRLLARGYTKKFLLPIFASISYGNRNVYLETRVKTAAPPVVAFSIRYSHNLAHFKIPRRLKSPDFETLLRCYPQDRRPRLLVSLKSNPSIGLLSRFAGSFGKLRLPRPHAD
jgi:hypothetical protein